MHMHTNKQKSLGFCSPLCPKHKAGTGWGEPVCVATSISFMGLDRRPVLGVTNLYLFVSILHWKQDLTPSQLYPNSYLWPFVLISGLVN